MKPDYKDWDIDELREEIEFYTNMEVNEYLRKEMSDDESLIEWWDVYWDVNYNIEPESEEYLNAGQEDYIKEKLVEIANKVYDPSKDPEVEGPTR